jgi:hypothetical protein
VSKLLSKLLVILLLPVLLPLLIYIGLTYSWEDTVPKEEDNE